MKSNVKVKTYSKFYSIILISFLFFIRFRMAYYNSDLWIIEILITETHSSADWQ